MTETIKVGDTVQGERIADMPDLGVVTDNSWVVGEHAGSGLFSAYAVKTYTNAPVIASLTAETAARIASDSAESAARIAADAAEVAARTAGDATFRRPLAGHTTWYVGLSGNDSNNGLAPAQGAFRTLQHAVDAVRALYDGRGFNGTISVENGTYSQGSGLVIDGPFVGFALFSITCASGAGSVVLNSTGHTILVQHQAQVTISGGFLLGCGAGYTCISANLDAQVHIGGLTIAPSVGGSLLYVSRGGYMEVDTSIHVATGTSGNLVQASHGGNFRHSNAASIIFDGNHVFSDCVLYVLAADLTITDGAGFNLSGHTVIGQRYRVSQPGLIQWALGTQTSIPGDSSGAEEQGGRYSFDNWPVEHAAGTFNYDLSTATGAVLTQATGFMPASIDFVTALAGAVAGDLGSTGMCAIGYTGAAPVVLANYCAMGGNQGGGPNATGCFQHNTGAGAGVSAAVTAVLNNGFSLTFAKSGAPTGTLTIFWRARRGL